jgi:hypothetical protein
VQQARLTHSTSASGATHVRSTLLQQSLRAVRKRGYFQRWETYVDPTYRDVIVNSIAPSWVDIDVGLAHYQACDKLELDDATLAQIGEGVGGQLQSTLVAAAARMATKAGIISQEMVNACFYKLWPRLFQGGSLNMSYQGKVVTIEVRGAVLSQSRYFRGTLLGNVYSGAKLFGQKVAAVRAMSYDERNDVYVVRYTSET